MSTKFVTFILIFKFSWIFVCLDHHTNLRLDSVKTTLIFTEYLEIKIWQKNAPLKGPAVEKEPRAVYQFWRRSIFWA